MGAHHLRRLTATGPVPLATVTGSREAPQIVATMAAKPLKDVVGVAKKYTQQSTGIWETIRRLFAVDPDRSNGVPVKHFRNPPPGGLDPKLYDEAVTTPAADIADNPYWRRGAKATSCCSARGRERPGHILRIGESYSSIGREWSATYASHLRSKETSEI